MLALCSHYLVANSGLQSALGDISLRTEHRSLNLALSVCLFSQLGSILLCIHRSINPESEREEREADRHGLRQVYTCMYVYHMRTCMHACIPTDTHTSSYKTCNLGININVHIYIYILLYTDVCVCVFTHAGIRTRSPRNQGGCIALSRNLLRCSGQAHRDWSEARGHLAI